MGEKQMIACFVLFTSVTSLQGLFRCGRACSKELDFRKFLGTKDNIWTYNTSAMEHAMCKFDHMKSISNKSIFFTRSFYEEKRHWTVMKLEGLFRKQDKHVMQIFSREKELSNPPAARSSTLL
ncbi:uncharacterized protein LOC142586882 [Dermacentor variabilis]|uniref:uncharacterized protein LOC142586882 n=1 Tax=Dermacentor variabilis TaxID=34621 RepID=UPI003F5B1F24